MGFRCAGPIVCSVAARVFSGTGSSAGAKEGAFMASTSGTDGVGCRVCGSNASELVAVVPFEVPPKTTTCALHRCLDCGSYWRAFAENTEIARHWEGRSYNHPEREELNRQKRRTFFEWIASIALPRTSNGTHRRRVLDVGCSYGHLLDLFAELNCECVGVEPAAALRDQQNATGKRKVYADVRDLPASENNFDV